MRVLLTGGLGYIGSHVAVELISEGHEVIFLDNLSNSNINVIDKLNEITKKEISFIEGDIRDTSLLIKVLKQREINSVVHLAGLKSVGESVSYPITYYENNVAGTVSLLKAMNESGIFDLIFSSSATVYGEPKYLPLDEYHETKSSTPYGRTKLHIEEMLLDLCKSDSKWSIISLRYFNPVGAHSSSLIGEDPPGIPNNLMPYLAKVALDKLPCLNIFGGDYPTKDGTGVRDYIHIEDLALGHVAAMNFTQKQNGFHVFNLGTGQGTSVLEMINAFESESNIKVNYKIVGRRDGDVAICFADPSKAEIILNWKATRGVNEMCRSYFNFLNQSAILKQ